MRWNVILANAVYVVVAGRHTVHGGWLRRRHHWHHRTWDGLHWSTCCRATQSLRSSLRLHWFVAWLLHNLCLRAVNVDSSHCLLYAHIWFLYTSHKTHTHPFNSPLSKTAQVSRYQKCKTNLDFTEARDSGSGFSWAICKSAPRCRQTTMPAPHRSVYYRPDALPATQPTVSMHWRQHHIKHNSKNKTN